MPKRWCPSEIGGCGRKQVSGVLGSVADRRWHCVACDNRWTTEEMMIANNMNRVLSSRERSRELVKKYEEITI